MGRLKAAEVRFLVADLAFGVGVAVTVMDLFPKPSSLRERETLAVA